MTAYSRDGKKVLERTRMGPWGGGNLPGRRKPNCVQPFQSPVKLAALLELLVLSVQLQRLLRMPEKGGGESWSQQIASLSEKTVKTEESRTVLASSIES